MKFIKEPTIELEEEEIETIKGIYKLIKDMPCTSLLCDKCPFNKICDYIFMGEPEKMVLNIQKDLNEALIK